MATLPSQEPLKNFLLSPVQDLSRNLQGHDPYGIVASTRLRDVSSARRVAEGVGDLGRLGDRDAAETPVVCFVVDNDVREIRTYYGELVGESKKRIGK